MQFNRGSLTLSFEFGCVHGDKIMSVRVEHNDKSYPVVPQSGLDSKVSIPVDLPGKILMVFSGKDNTQDTIVDSQGKILQDLYVKITGISLDGFTAVDSILHKCFTLETESGEQITSSYIGFNGRIEFELPKSDVFSQIMSWRRTYR